MEVAEVVQESLDCRSFYLVDPYRQELPPFLPGQYVMVRPALAGQYQVTRCYSLSSSPDHRFWRITVKEHPLNKASHTGGLSSWLHQSINVGDCLFIGGPSGQFYLPDEVTGPIVLVAAGVGITPIASMLRSSLENMPQRPVTLVYQAQDSEHWPLGTALHSWQADFSNLQAHTFFSRTSEEEVADVADAFPGSFHVGKVDGGTLRQFVDDPNANYYFCGPEAWMEQLRQELIANGVAAGQLHWESFGSAAPQSVLPSSTQAHRVTFQHSGIVADWSDPEQSLWEFARANDIYLPSGCLSGACGSCRCKLIRGEVEYDRRIGVELANDEVLTCVARPKSAVELDA